jgi:plastocyanin
MFRLGGDGNFTAYDAKSGDVLWQFQTGFPGGGGPPSTFEIGGEQYIAVSAGPVVWAFKLGGTLHPLPGPELPRETQDAFTGPIEDTNQIETTSLQHDINTTGQRYFIDEYSFSPYRARIKVGTRMTWINNGRLVHTIIAKDGSWTTGPISAGAFGFATFDKPGNYTYISKEYPWSYGEIIVTPATNNSGKSAAVGTPGERASSTGGRFAEQAQRGKDEYDKNCGSCHGQDLSGRDPAPALVGDTFELHWLGRSVDDLFARVHSTMPQTNPGSLPPQTCLDIVAFLLQANNISVGNNALTDNAENLKKLKISSQ